MSVSAVGSSSPDPVSSSAASRDVERQVTVMKRTRDVEQQAAESLIELVKKAQPAPGRIDTYA